MTSAYKPVKPIKFEPDHIYLQVSYTSPDPPGSVTFTDRTANTSAASLSSREPMVETQYLGPVGELKGEAIYTLVRRDGTPVKRDEQVWTSQEKDLVANVRSLSGVKSVKVMPEFKQRAKRDEF